MAKQRVSGYHYITLRNGRRKRVYSGAGAKRPATGKRMRGAPARRSNKYAYKDVIMGVGSYHLGRRRASRGGGKLRMGNQAPRVANSNGRFIITHEEYLGDLNSSQAFVNTPFALNPGLTLAEGGFCNWLPNVAQQFEQWKPKGIVFMFKSTSSDAVLSTAANSALGTVSMATDYNPLNPAFASKVQMENYEHSVSTKPSNNLRHYVECSKRQTPVSELFVRSGAVPAGADIRLYDLGLFQIAASGQQVAGGAMGEVWVSYTIEFLKPRILPGIGGENDGDVNFDHIQIYNAGKTTTGVLPATPFGTGTNSAALLIPTTQSTLGGIVTGGQQTAAGNFGAYPSPTLNNFLGGVPVLAGGLPTGALGAGAPNTYYFPPGVSTGNYMVQYNAKWGATGVPANEQIVATNCVALNLMNADATNVFNNDSSANTTTTCQTFFVSISRANAFFSMTGTAGATTPTWADLFVTQIPSPVVPAPVAPVQYIADLFNLNAMGGGEDEITPMKPFGVTAGEQLGDIVSTLGGTVNCNASRYTFPPNLSQGSFLCQYTSVYNQPGTGGAPIQNATLTNCERNNLFNDGGEPWVANSAAPTDVDMLMFWMCITAPGASFVLAPESGAADQSENNQCYLSVVQVSGTNINP